MVYLLHAYFGREGRDEADELLLRNSGSADSPRILGAFNEETPDWLSFFMFTYFTDRDGKYQLGTLKESGFDPLSRTCEFMLKEEAHHMFVGTTGVDRVVERTAQLMREHDTDDVAARGGIPLEVIQKYLNFHYSVSLDLFGGETSTNVANYYTAGLKGRWQEDRRERRPQADQRVDHGRYGDRERRDRAVRGGRADRAQHRPAPGVRRRLPDRRQPVEPDPGQRRDRFPAAAAARGVQPEGGRVRRDRGHAIRRASHARRSGSGGRARGCRPRWTRPMCGR